MADVPGIFWRHRREGDRYFQVKAVYSGSGTATNGGVRARFGNYKAGRNFAWHCDRALRDGVTFTHIALLAYCPIPAPAARNNLRTLIHTLEGILTGVFWAMRPRDTSYGLKQLCSWPRDSFPWVSCVHTVPYWKTSRAEAKSILPLNSWSRPCLLPKISTG